MSTNNRKLSTTVNGIEILNRKHPYIKWLQDQGYEPTVHGDKVWTSTYLMMDFLKEFPLKKGLRVMEVGCGWGLTK